MSTDPVPAREPRRCGGYAGRAFCRAVVARWRDRSEPASMLLPEHLHDLADEPMERLRTLRTAYVETETGLSYLRRMVQGPLDIVRAELQRRAAGSGPSDLAELVASLPETLGDQPRPSGVGRLVQTLEPTNLDPDLVAELEAIAPASRITAVPDLDDATLSDFAEELRTFEAKISELRREAFALIDALQAEITRRYRTGEATVESLLET